MEEKKCLIAGLPDAGKSTYLGALWYIFNNDVNKDKMSLKVSSNNPPENLEQLSILSSRWLNVEDMDRTSTDVPSNISFNLVPQAGGEELTLEVPDFRGESIRQIITQNQPKEFDEWCEQADTMLYLMSDIAPGLFADDYLTDEDEEEEEEAKVPAFEVNRISPAAQNMLILRYLAEKKHYRKVVICLTAWDKVMDFHSGTTPEEYVRESSPALYNFIKYHYPEVVFFGLSAQGSEYEYEEFMGDEGQTQKRVTEACKKRLRESTRKGERAFVVVDKDKNPDITLPIAELLK